jgi:RNA polymerase sigma factor
MNTESVNKRVEMIKSHDDDINAFINEYKPFIASCVTKITGRFVRYGEDDELSIALLAFTEAIRSFDPFKGNFLPFASNVIKRRLVDYYRKEKKHENVVYLNEYTGEEDNEEADLTYELSKQQHIENQANEYRRLEINELAEELTAWGISFGDLVNISPKHDKTRKACL